MGAVVMPAFVNDPDFTLHVGDALEVLRQMPAISVHCCVTSPPYWGLRDYSTEGQLGLEATPDLYVANMVAVFREVRRVLRADGTLWLNIGDSYAGGAGGRGDVGREIPRGDGTTGQPSAKHTGARLQSIVPSGLKPKDLVGIPWRLAFALQADGWFLRSDIIWSKPNPMPESVTDRPTKAHEYLFLLTKSPRYFYDADAIREPHARLWDPVTNGGSWAHTDRQPAGSKAGHHSGAYPEPNPAGRNKRSVWEIATEAYPDAHFATFPQALVEPCIKAGCPEWVCGTCGKPRERIVERVIPVDVGVRDGAKLKDNVPRHRGGTGRRLGQAYTDQLNMHPPETVGWSDCGHDNYQPGVVLDPFLGSGTTAQVARRLGRKCVGIELNPEYARLAAKRLSQLSLFACVVDESAGLAEPA